MSVLKNVSRRTNRSRPASISYAIAFALNLAALLLALGCSQTARLDASQDAKPELRVGTSGDYAPFSVREPHLSHVPRGFSIGVAEAYAKHTGREIRWIDFIWPNLAPDLAADRFDLALSGVTVRPDRSILGRFSLPLTISGAVALVPAESALKTRSDLSRMGVGIAVNAGGHLERTARKLFPEARVVPIATNAGVLGALDRDGISAVITDTLEAPHWQARRPGLRPIGPLTQDRKAAWFPVSREQEARRFDLWMLAAEKEGTLAALREQHGLPNARTATPTAALLSSLDERLSLMIDVAQAKQILGSPIEDLEREARVLAAAGRGIERAAEEYGTQAPPDAAIRDFYASQIEAAKSIQRTWTAHAPPPAATTKDVQLRAQTTLDQEIRPALIYLGDRIARLVSRVLAEGDRAPTRSELTLALARHNLPEARIDAIADAITALLEEGDRR